MPKIIVGKEIEYSDRALVIAKALFAATTYPGQPINKLGKLWPPKPTSTYVNYINRAKAVDAALTENGF